MKILGGKHTEFFGLDLGTVSLRAVQLKGTGPTKSLEKFGTLATDGVMTLSDAEADRQKTTAAIAELIKQTGITTKNVAVNLPSTHVFTTVVEMDRMTDEDLARTIAYQAESFIPTPPNKSKIDWAVIGNSTSNPKKLEVLLSSIPNEYIENRLQMIEAAGLNVIAFEPDSMALVRAILPADSASCEMVLDIGRAATDLIVSMDGNPHLTRTIPTGTGALIKAAADYLHIQPDQASQFIYKFGLSKEYLEGKLNAAIVGIVENLMSEIEKSIKYIQGRYPNTKIERIVVTGGASSVPELPLFIANRVGIEVEIGNAWRNVSYPAGRQNELLAVSNHFGVAVGLAERKS